MVINMHETGLRNGATARLFQRKADPRQGTRHRQTDHTGPDHHTIDLFHRPDPTDQTTRAQLARLGLSLGSGNAGSGG